MKAGRQTRPSLLRLLGPGLVTGAADDDPSGIATYSQAGAQFGFALCWTMSLTLPFMAAIQIISATIGWQTRRGLARNHRPHACRRPALSALVALLVVANTINIAADLAAMGEALRLVVGGPVALLRRWLRAGLPHGRDIRAVSPLCRLSQVPHAGAARLCRRRVQCRCSVGTRDSVHAGSRRCHWIETIC